jgi:hypothetical protein
LRCSGNCIRWVLSNRACGKFCLLPVELHSTISSNCNAPRQASEPGGQLLHGPGSLGKVVIHPCLELDSFSHRRGDCSIDQAFVCCHVFHKLCTDIQSQSEPGHVSAQRRHWSSLRFVGKIRCSSRSKSQDVGRNGEPELSIADARCTSPTSMLSAGNWNWCTQWSAHTIGADTAG